MLTITQLRRLTGVSRRTLQDYDALGLLKHRDTTPGGYWLYAPEDVERLSVIQLLHHFGYTRKEILEVIDDPEISLAQLLDRAQASLTQKRDRLNCLLEHIDLMRLQLDFPESVLELMMHIVWQEVKGGHPVMELYEAATANACQPEMDAEDRKTCLSLTLLLYVLAVQPEDALGSSAIRDCILYMRRICPTDLAATDADFVNLMEELTGDADFDAQTRPGAGAFVRKALLLHMKSLPGAGANGKATE